VYVSLSLVRKHWLRRGDAITGAVRQPREGEQQRQKFNPLVRVDTINGLDVEQARQRPEFTKLTPLYPNERLRLETEQNLMTTRVIDLVMPIGKGQRALIVSPPKAGKTILSGGVDSTALYPPKRFLGAARNIEDGGSLTIFATALVETGSTMDTVIFEEFKGTGNAELKLDRKIADKRIFPAIDVNPSGTRKEELLLPPDELAIHHKLRRVLSGLESQQAIDVLLDRLRKTRTNIEFLMQVSKSTAGNGDD
jgi:transcription termination factor Rho